MKSHIFLIALFLPALVFPATPLPAQKLDIFHTRKPYSKDIFFKASGLPDLGQLNEDEVDGVLAQYQRNKKRTRVREEKNLLTLAIAYLYLKKNDPVRALQHLKNGIVGNFILEDFRLHFQAAALKKLAEQNLETKQYSKAVSYLMEAIQLRMAIIRSYPDSPFHDHVSRDLAEAERLLGDAYFKLRNFRGAWQAYRKALMREFPDDAEHRQEVSLALAATYEAAGEMEEAADIYTSLLKDFVTPEIRMAVSLFLENHSNFSQDTRTALKKQLARSNLLPNGKTPKKQVAKKPEVKRPTFENKMVREFYQSLTGGDPIHSLELGLAVLTHFPGIRETRGVKKEVNRLILDYLQDHPWAESIDRLISLYPARTLNSMGNRLWRNNRYEHSVRFFEKILEQHPLETETCHKAVFFLGRIREDQGDFPGALKYYNLLVEKYDFGPYTTAALFKIPWIERLQGNFDLARIHFERLLDFYESKAYLRLNHSYNHNAGYRTATHYWLAQTMESLGFPEGKHFRLKRMIQKFPFDFYSVISRKEAELDLKSFLSPEKTQEIAFREPGLGEIGRKHLSRAEKLISVGFLKEGAEELAQLTAGQDHPAFLFYLARLFHSAGGFQESIRLSWSLARKNSYNYLSTDLAMGLFPQAFLEKVEELARQHGLDPLFILSLMRQESAFNPEIISSANAIGLMQLLPSTAAEVARARNQEVPTPEQLKNPETNIRLGVDYLKYLLTTFDDNPVYALAAYNAGPNKVRYWKLFRAQLSPLEFIESIPYNETRSYVKKILRNYAIYRTLYRGQNPGNLKELLTISRQ